MRAHNWIGTVMLGAATLIVVTTAAARAEEGATFAALNKAYERETEARACYLECARVADEEGLPRVGCLFRAVASAESVHAASHAWVIEKQGGRPPAWSGAIQTADTERNLETACALEHAEHELVYRRFLEYARTECDYDALASFLYASSAERSHEQLFQAALDTLRDRRMRQTLVTASLEMWVLPDPDDCGPAQDYRLCMGCGYMCTRPAKRCPNCGFNCSHTVVHACR
jgi:rubrerythrin